MNTTIGEQPIRIGIIGYGYRGRYLHQLLGKLSGCIVVGIASPSGEAMSDIPVFDRANGYRTMLETLRPDLVLVASPWHCHIEQAMACIEAGADVALEIRGGKTLGEYDQLTERSQSLGRKVFPLENTIFMRECMAVVEMARQGVFGEIISLSGGYRHDLRALLWDSEGGAASWRSASYTETNGDLYPTHGIAPIALCAGLGRGNAPTRLSSFASASRGLSAYYNYTECNKDIPPLCTGDIITTIIETERGTLLRLTHDTTLPRPRSLDYEVQGTLGIWQGEHRRIYLTGTSPHETWEDDAPYIARYEHPLWRALGTEALQHDAHHSGMDYIMLYSVLSAHRGEGTYPITLDDLALWTSITPLSSRSIALGSAVPFQH